MAALSLRRRRTTQPLQLAQIDWSNPLTRGLVFATHDLSLPFSSTGHAQTQINRAQLARTVDAGVRGIAANAYASLGAVSLPGSVRDAIVGSPYSLAWVCGPLQSSVGGQLLYGNRNDPQGTAVLTLVLTPGQVSISSSSTTINFNRSSLTQGGCMSLSVNASTVTLRNSGGKVGPTAGSSPNTIGLPAATTILPHLLNKGDGNRGFLSGVGLFAIWNRDLSPAEQAAWEMNPWQIFKPQARRLWMVGSTSGTYVLQATAGAFLLSASQATLSASRRLVAAAGTLTSNGASASLVSSRRLTGNPGAFTASGSSASILAARKLAATFGTFALTGTATPITVTRRLIAQSGSFELSPGTVQMVYTPTPGPGGPTYTLTTVAGAFALTAGAAGVLARRRLGAASGAFVWSGAAATLLVGRRMLTSTGTFVATGGSVTIRAARCVLAQTGTFSLTGADAQLRYSAQVTYARALAGPGYVPQQHYNESRPAASNVARPAALQRNRR